MNTEDTDLIERLHAMADEFAMAPASLADDVRRGRRRVRHNQSLVAGIAAAVVVVAVGITAVIGGQDRADGPEPANPPPIAVSSVPVWYDAQGLHHGDIVEKTPVSLLVPEQSAGGGRVIPASGALALVRTGALYWDGQTRDVWFHPWGGEPRIVGHDSAAGPGGDPQGDTAAWFEGSELVVYDTAEGREVSRTTERSGNDTLSGDHNPPGNSFLQVSAEHVVWRAMNVLSHDLRTGTTSVLPEPSYLLDAHNGIRVFGDREASTLSVSVPGQSDESYPDLEARGRLSPSGNYVLTVEGSEQVHAAQILDIRTGELWMPDDGYPWIAWSYGDMAMVDVEEGLLACDVGVQACEKLPAERPFLMPTN
jgi:hypothetical protein